VMFNKLRLPRNLVRITRDRFRKSNFEVSQLYRIEGTKYLTSDISYLSDYTFPNFQEQLEVFKALLIESVSKSLAKSFYKFGDGDYYFLAAKEVGSAKPGNRALSIPYSEIGLDTFSVRSKKNDYYLCEIPSHNQDLFRKTFHDLTPSFPAEYAYGLIANRWLTQKFAGKIGIIGAGEKVQIIKELLRHPVYQRYLGLEKFEDYISIPQKYACDNLASTLDSLGEQLKNATSQIFLVGVGHVKSGILSELSELHEAVYLDIGSGVDALAGVIDTKRPYFADWKNYQLAEPEFYENIDLLQYNHGNEVRLKKLKGTDE
jgi:hypothetical protein